MQWLSIGCFLPLVAVNLVLRPCSAQDAQKDVPESRGAIRRQQAAKSGGERALMRAQPSPRRGREEEKGRQMPGSLMEQGSAGEGPPLPYGGDIYENTKYTSPQEAPGDDKGYEGGSVISTEGWQSMSRPWVVRQKLTRKIAKTTPAPPPSGPHALTLSAGKKGAGPLADMFSHASAPPKVEPKADMSNHASAPAKYRPSDKERFVIHGHATKKTASLVTNQQATRGTAAQTDSLTSRTASKVGTNATTQTRVFRAFDASKARELGPSTSGSAIPMKGHRIRQLIFHAGRAGQKEGRELGPIEGAYTLQRKPVHAK
eukprot:TRINITY_DN57638_c0_g1_i1.p1 TRINITY_DN57638_c0_g1~~TRINITY_DN57638_c0_g1_i1.p1  ORF type:complete len:348 (+),score=28.72 TRINITY_DN57638_c0_g1_i1:99-1046(+)